MSEDTLASVTDAEFRAALLRRRRRIDHAVEMLDPSGTVVASLPITGGSVDFDGLTAESFAASVTLTDKRFVPTGPTSLLDPRSGHLCRIWWRMEKPDRSGWWRYPLATVRLGKPRIRAAGGTVSMSLTGRDVFAESRRRGYGDNVVAVGGMTVTDALRTLFESVAPGVPVSVGSSSVLLPAVYELAESDPAEDWEKIAGLGLMTCRPTRWWGISVQRENLPTSIHADLQEGPDCPVVELNREVDDEIYNWVRVVSTNPDVVPTIEAVRSDTDPGSPTYIGGPYGTFRKTIPSDVVATQAAADNLAETEYRRLRLPTETVDVQMRQRPDFEFGHQVVAKSDGAGTAGLFRIAGWSIPLKSAGPMTVRFLERSLS